jgi:hypothetical protein
MNRIVMPRLPVYEPKRHGNPFAWIVAVSPKIRAERASALWAQRWRSRP